MQARQPKSRIRQTICRSLKRKSVPYSSTSPSDEGACRRVNPNSYASGWYEIWRGQVCSGRHTDIHRFVRGGSVSLTVSVRPSHVTEAQVGAMQSTSPYHARRARPAHAAFPAIRGVSPSGTVTCAHSRYIGDPHTYQPRAAFPLARAAAVPGPRTRRMVARGRGAGTTTS